MDSILSPEKVMTAAAYHKIRCAWCLNGSPCPNYDDLLQAEMDTVRGLRMTPKDRDRLDRAKFASVESQKVGDVIRITATEHPTTTDHGCIVRGHMEGNVLVVDQIEDLPPDEKP
jgi:hypothetical protein